MPVSFVFAIVLGLVGVGLNVGFRVARRKPQTKEVLTSSYSNKTETRPSDAAQVATGLKWAGRVFAVSTALLLLVASYNPVSTKNVGIVTEGGRPVGSLSNGIHFILPWEKVTEMDAAIQTDYHTAQNGNTCVTIRIAHQATACADVIIKWRVDEKTAGTLFQNYRDFDNVRLNLIDADLQSAMNQAFSGYDALAVNDTGDSTATALPDLATTVTKTMIGDVSNLAEIQAVQIPVVHFDGKTQDALNQLQNQIAQTRIAAQEQKTNQAQAAANQILAASVSNDPNVLVSKCLDLVAKGISLPAGFSCWPASGLPVTVPVK